MRVASGPTARWSPSSGEVEDRTCGTHLSHSKPGASATCTAAATTSVRIDQVPRMASAGKLVISEETVRSHAKHILNKLGQPNRVQAVLAAVRTGVIDPAQIITLGIQNLHSYVVLGWETGIRNEFTVMRRNGMPGSVLRKGRTRSL